MESRTTGTRWWYRPLMVIGLTLTIFGGTIYFTSRDLQRKIENQIARQDAQILYALWQRQELAQETEMMDFGDQYFILLETIRPQIPQLAGLYGVRLFTHDGRCYMADPSLSDTNSLSADELASLTRLEPFARYISEADLSDVQLVLPDEMPQRGPLLEISIPLHLHNQARLLGVAQFVLDGSRVAVEFEMLKQNLIQQGITAFAVGGLPLTTLLALAFWQLQRVNRLLAQRTHRLLGANQELAMAAKSSAVGAVAAHLLHGLKNPLTGLQAFVTAQGVDPDKGSDWQLAVSSTRRMQNMIAEIVQVLRDEHGASQYEISLEELLGVLGPKILPLAREAGIQFRSHCSGDATLTNREANLISLILYNLVQNAIQATPAGRTVTLSCAVPDGEVVCEVRDEGPGISETQMPYLFKPCQSTKGGSGVGLAISKQLASCLGAELELRRTSPQGSVFLLRIPRKAQEALSEITSSHDASS